MTLYISIKIIKIITLRYEHRTITVRESAHNVTQDINHTLKEVGRSVQSRMCLEIEFQRVGTAMDRSVLIDLPPQVY